MTRKTLEIAAFCIALIVAAMAVHAWLASRDEQQRLAATLAAQKQVIDAASADERARQSSLAAALAQIEKLKRDVQTPAQILAALPKYLQLPQPITLAPASTPDSASPSEQGTAAQSKLLAPIPPDLSSRARSPAASPQTADEGSAFASASQNQQQIPRSARNDSSPGMGFSVEAQGFSPAKNDGRNSPSSVPQAAAKGESPEQQCASPAPPCDPAGNCAAQIPSADLKPLFDYVQDCRACQAQLAAAQKNSADYAAKIAALTRERDAAVTASKGGSFLRRLRRNALWFAIGAAAGYAAAHR